MIQLNMLPDVKVNLMRAKRMNRTVIVIAVVSGIVAIAIAAAMFSLMSVQKKHVSDLDKDITKYSRDLGGIENLTKILTVQNQLSALPALYDGRPAVKRLPAYLDQMTPSSVSLSDVEIDFAAGTLNITGTSKALSSVNQYVDTFKFTNYTVDKSTDVKTAAFSNVVMQSFSKNDTQVTFAVQMLFDPVIFDNTQVIELVVPTTTTTRSQTSAPSTVFDTTTETP